MLSKMTKILTLGCILLILLISTVITSAENNSEQPYNENNWIPFGNSALADFRGEVENVYYINGYICVIGSRKRLWYTNVASLNSFEDLNGNLNWTESPERVMDITFSQVDNKYYVVVFDKGLYKTEDFTSSIANWEKLTHEGLSDHYSFDCIRVDQKGQLYVGGDIGCYRLDKSTSIRENKNTKMLQGFRLDQNYPNPFNPETTIPFYLPKPGKTDLTIYNLLGQRIRNLVSGHLQTGSHSVVWDGTDMNGKDVPSGVYFARAETYSVRVVKKLNLIR